VLAADVGSAAAADPGSVERRQLSALVRAYNAA
jgi:hypothetical protein